eukprot:gene15133-biopygen4169
MFGLNGFRARLAYDSSKTFDFVPPQRDKVKRLGRVMSEGVQEHPASHFRGSPSEYARLVHDSSKAFDFVAKGSNSNILQSPDNSDVELDAPLFRHLAPGPAFGQPLGFGLQPPAFSFWPPPPFGLKPPASGVRPPAFSLQPSAFALWPSLGSSLRPPGFEL